MNIVYKNLNKCDICLGLFEGFVRRQEVGYCLRQREGRWAEEYHPFVDDWSAADYVKLVRSLTSLLEDGGAVVGAFIIGICENIIRSLGWSTFSDAFTFALLIVVLCVKPTGLFGEKLEEKV